MHTFKFGVLTTAMLVTTLTAPFVAHAQNPCLGSFNASGFYMMADDADLYLDFAGFSMKLGFYVTPTTELIGEISFADGLDLPDHLDYSMNLGLLAGVTQYIPLSDISSLYVRGKAGITHNTWEYDPWYLAEEYGCRYCGGEEDDTYFTAGIGGGVSIVLGQNVSLEAGYDYLTLNVSNDDGFEDDGTDWPGYHVIHAGIDILF